MDRTVQAETSDWRACLKTYVHRLSRFDTGEGEDLADLVEDIGYLVRWKDRARRLGGASHPWPVRAEIRCRPLEVSSRDGHVRTRVRLFRRLTYEDGRVEERIEHEKLDFARRHGRWTIVRAEPEVPEKHVSGSGKLGAVHSGPGTGPYINRNVLAPPVRPLRYNREAAREYAETWWNGANPKYHEFRVDCTNFVSQCLFAGGLPMDYTGRRETGWWYEGYVNGRERWSFSWAVAHSLHAYLLGGSTPPRGSSKADPRELLIGDVICYDWDGDGRWQHNVIVTGHDPQGWPLVNAHTNNSRHRFWDYRDSYAWSEQTRYAFIHVPDGR